MRILYVTDLHGDQRKYERVFELARSEHVDIVVNGGDMLPNEGDLHRQGDFITEFLDSHFSLFDAACIYYLCFLGNDDLRIFDGLLDDVCTRHEFAVPIAQRRFDVKGVTFIGMNWVVDSPFTLKDRSRMDTSNYEFQEQFGPGELSLLGGWFAIRDWQAYARTIPTIEDELRALVRPTTVASSIYVIHMPPAGIGLDRCYDGREVGSVAVYKFLKEQQPMLSLHGHIHESPEKTGKWLVNLGETVCIQPGQGERFTWVLIDLVKREFVRQRDRDTYLP